MMLEIKDRGAPSDAKDSAPATVSGLAPFLSQESVRGLPFLIA
jgi:hypothetical protein